METLQGGAQINLKREAEGLHPLKIVVVCLVSPPAVPGQTTADKKVSSTDFRERISKQTSPEQFAQIEQKWTEATSTLPKEVQTIWFWRLVQYYSESWRKYHNLQHIHELITKISQAKQDFVSEGKKGLTDTEEKYLILVAYFHDVIYTPTSKLNEKVGDTVTLEEC